VGGLSWWMAKSSWARWKVFEFKQNQGQESRPGQREYAAQQAVTNCDIICKVGSLGWAWVSQEATSHGK